VRLKEINLNIRRLAKKLDNEYMDYAKLRT
jgi:hypothetical protein